MTSILLFVCGAVLAIAALLYLAQERLIFYPQPAPLEAPCAPGHAITEVRFPAADGLRLRGWLARPLAAGSRRLPLVIYFGGNAEETSSMAALAAQFAGWSLLAVNYRGYGGNPGAPSERALFADALAAYDFAVRRPDVEAQRIVVIGRSLGSGVAVYLASQRALAGVVLVTPYDSLRAVARRHYPFVPVSLLLKHAFDSLARAPDIETPVLMLAAQLDTIIPTSHARVLYAQWRGPKVWIELAGAGHNDLDADPAYWASIARFLQHGAVGFHQLGLDVAAGAPQATLGERSKIGT